MPISIRNNAVRHYFGWEMGVWVAIMRRTLGEMSGDYERVTKIMNKDTQVRVKNIKMTSKNSNYVKITPQMPQLKVHPTQSSAKHFLLDDYKVETNKMIAF